MSATATFTSQAVAEWVRLFPRQATETYTSSVTFMKQLTVVAVSTITYLKNVFPEESYTVENFGGIKLRVLKKKCRHELAQFVSTALTQAFEAFDKKYLHQLVICFYDGECKIENLVEYHIFEYLYSPEGVTMNVHSKTRDSAKSSTRYDFDNVRERTLHLIRACVVIMQACQNDMPESYDVSLRLYYNEDAPEGYQAPGFLSTTEDQDHLEPTLPETVKLGWVETPFHRMTARTYIRESMGSSHDAIPSQNAPKMTQNDQDDFESSSAMRSTSDASEIRILCPCNKFDADESTHALLTCHYCSTQQHAACFGLSRENAARVQRHCCTECSDMEPSREPTDPRLAALGVKKRERHCCTECSDMEPSREPTDPRLAALGVKKREVSHCTIVTQHKYSVTAARSAPIWSPAESPLTRAWRPSALRRENREPTDPRLAALGVKKREVSHCTIVTQHKYSVTAARSAPIWSPAESPLTRAWRPSALRREK
ncbi:hypothetical protein PYW07_016182 [Mythimna separata]|uniref:HORMA domain-containing protein n=1 Tax=Mythimna separata TaxID=271217 RepID=A0AAD7YQN1_MYTSE|nr:hypothetical protein PYW07_016182 [Mythimna separata]